MVFFFELERQGMPSAFDEAERASLNSRVEAVWSGGTAAKKKT